MSFGKLLVANRGEIAVRIFRACRELGIRTVAVYSEADEGSMHRRMADEAYPIGPAPASESYLNIERLVEVILESGAEAVHPGYGFLAESAAFARAVREAGAVWVGPPPEAMEAMALKVRAKEIARRAGVPTVPGYDGEDASEERLAAEARRIGYPVLIKASAGGGGRGMRAVARPQDFLEAVRAARREALSAFGDGSVFLEKFIEHPRHIEVQVIGDEHGKVLHLFERECSIQRRHQKVIEEAPSPALEPELREEICSAAVRLAREAGYRNAGTVEFLLDGEAFYFLEMNARLQVEHPVTEMVTGTDLVQLQLAVAAGEPLPLSQEALSFRGHAIEARIYAEGEGGLPAGGRLLLFAPPEGPGIRNDVGVESGDQVPVHYDPMISKLIVFAPTRRMAVRRLRRALEDYTVLGVPTNLPLLRRIAENAAFEAGETTTDFLERHRLAEPPVEIPVPEEAVMLAAAGELASCGRGDDPFAAGPWRHLGSVRLRYRTGDSWHRVEAERLGGRRFRLVQGGEEAEVEVLAFRNGELHATVDGRPVRAGIALEDGAVRVSLGGTVYELFRPRPPEVDEAGGAAAEAAGLVAPMPGTVVKVVAEEGQRVEEGQPLLVLEAMKMEQPVTAPHAGVVRSLPYKEGDLVPGGAVLAEIERED
ncbi:3-methylcrotonoyl-CoA carboxylase, alpha subunit [Rubrobacter xylanophilus DSM 9941]|uniref:Biotin-dependent 3-methylcrotonyl-coenzyme A carboxylase alpha1 subunit n=1 Tax=Rubrobacter xylanophilus (strain DSM 9941 / JCM 11954 / NBRC 16129 / PRD-1) TaxID=266117 RepID=Q1AVB6_RUBXD|nr:biotin carboxylase N-terminal domain-containing protein [Rubrobacter xylanophilus]ABG04662.1 3-methylcrotonoyl-CoA carboxylase, alpha subunit [Rubrobacter xylanophilus DSM 9941]